MTVVASGDLALSPDRGWDPHMPGLEGHRAIPRRPSGCISARGVSAPASSGSSAPPFRAEHPLRGLFADIRLPKLQARSSVVEVELP